MGKHTAPGPTAVNSLYQEAAGLCRWNCLDISLARDRSGYKRPKENTHPRAPVTLQLLENDLDGKSLWKCSTKKTPRLYCSWLEKNLEAFWGMNDLQDTSFVKRL